MLVKILMLMKITLRFHLDINKNTQHSVQKHMPQSVISLVIFELLSGEACDTDSVENNLCKVGKQGTAQPDVVNNLKKNKWVREKHRASKIKRGKDSKRVEKADITVQGVSFSQCLGLFPAKTQSTTTHNRSQCEL